MSHSNQNFREDFDRKSKEAHRKLREMEFPSLLLLRSTSDAIYKILNNLNKNIKGPPTVHSLNMKLSIIEVHFEMTLVFHSMHVDLDTPEYIADEELLQNEWMKIERIYGYIESSYKKYKQLIKNEEKSRTICMKCVQRKITKKLQKRRECS